MFRSLTSMLLAMSCPRLRGEVVRDEPCDQVERHHDHRQYKRGTPGSVDAGFRWDARVLVLAVDEYRQRHHAASKWVEVHRISGTADDQEWRGLANDPSNGDRDPGDDSSDRGGQHHFDDRAPLGYS